MISRVEKIHTILYNQIIRIYILYNLCMGVLRKHPKSAQEALRISRRIALKQHSFDAIVKLFICSQMKNEKHVSEIEGGHH